MYFARIGFLLDRLKRVEKYGTLHAHPSDDAYPREVKCVVFDFSRMTHIDARYFFSKIKIRRNK